MRVPRLNTDRPATPPPPARPTPRASPPPPAWAPPPSGRTARRAPRFAGAPTRASAATPAAPRRCRQPPAPAPAAVRRPPRVGRRRRRERSTGTRTAPPRRPSAARTGRRPAPPHTAGRRGCAAAVRGGAAARLFASSLSHHAIREASDGLPLKHASTAADKPSLLLQRAGKNGLLSEHVSSFSGSLARVLLVLMFSVRTVSSCVAAVTLYLRVAAASFSPA